MALRSKTQGATHTVLTLDVPGLDTHKKLTLDGKVLPNGYTATRQDFEVALKDATDMSTTGGVHPSNQKYSTPVPHTYASPLRETLKGTGDTAPASPVYPVSPVSPVSPVVTVPTPTREVAQPVTSKKPTKVVKLGYNKKPFGFTMYFTSKALALDYLYAERIRTQDDVRDNIETRNQVSMYISLAGTLGESVFGYTLVEQTSNDIPAGVHVLTKADAQAGGWFDCRK